MTPREFVEKWGPRGSAYALNERAGAQAHFLDLCQVINVPGPSDPENYCFERGLRKTGAGRGFADVWKRGCFAWEYKAPKADLSGALQQLMQYALPLENPPLLIVSDRLRIDLHTHFTGHPSVRHTFLQDDVVDPAVQAKLRSIFNDPERFKPKQTSRQITEDAAKAFADMADRLRGAGIKNEVVSHFLTQCLFCFFAEDVKLLPEKLFDRVVQRTGPSAETRTRITTLFKAMRSGGDFGADSVHWFNGGLFTKIEVPQISEKDVQALRAASKLDWSAIDPSIFGTLFERGLDPKKRGQIGAHYTDAETIRKIIEPVIEAPLRNRWLELRPAIANSMAKSKKHSDTAWKKARTLYASFLEELRLFRVLDPACGSGNFLYIALKSLKDFEHEVSTDMHLLGFDREVDLVTGPQNVLGIEIGEFAAELARVTVWIGELQWRLDHGYMCKTNPVLEPMEHIQCRDALLNDDGAEASWPAANAIVGNPPFLGGNKKRRGLGPGTFDSLGVAYSGRVTGAADLVCYWFDKARLQIESGRSKRAGLVSTQSIRNGVSRMVLDAIARNLRISEAWSDEPWVNDGAAVRVSLIVFESPEDSPQRNITLNGISVPGINADLTSSAGINITRATRLDENQGIAFQGSKKVGPFEVDANVARHWLLTPNPNGKPNSDVVRRNYIGLDITRRPRDRWIVDFGTDTSETDSALYELPFAYVRTKVLPARIKNGRASRAKNWWRHGDPQAKMRRAVANLTRFIATSEVSKHRVFIFLDSTVLPDCKLMVIASQDDAVFGILQSKIHTLWAFVAGSMHGDGNNPRYTPSTCFETFPFPQTLDPNMHSLPDTSEFSRIGRSARELLETRERWLNPSEWVDRFAEVIPALPIRKVAKRGLDAQVRQRTLTNLYNLRPTWLDIAHAKLDHAVAEAYGWEWPLDDNEILRRLFQLNQQRSRAVTSND